MGTSKSDLTLSAARQTEKMIGRESELRRLKDSLEPGGAFRIVLVRGRGGIGKTRLLEELLSDLGLDRDDDDQSDLSEPTLPADTGRIVVSNIIDVIDARLHDRYRFLSALRDGLLRYRANVNLDSFNSKRGEVENLLASGALLGTLSKAQNELAQAFIDDLKAITQQRRVVFLVDTVERLSYPGFDWLLDDQLLLPSDLEIRTHQWLQSFIKCGLMNVTLVLAGRDRVYDEPEGERFFGRIKQAVEQAASTGAPVELVDINLKPLSDDETRQYLVQLAADWRGLGSKYRARAQVFERTADPDRNRFRTLRLLTGGIPVRLALYAQVIAQGWQIPEPLKLPYSEACHRAEVTPEDLLMDFDALVAARPKLLGLQWDVEEEFIRLLFTEPDSLRQKLLRTLVRAPRGLTPEQLHFALFTSGDNEKEWEQYFATPPGKREKTYREMLGLLKGIAKKDYLGRGRPRLDEIVLYVENPITGAATNRFGLQDEIYRIYAEHIGLFAEPVSPSTQSIRESMEAHRSRYEESWKRERDRRGLLFKKLAYFAGHEFERFLEMKRALLMNDEVQFEEHYALDSPETYNFPQLHLAQRNERLALHTVMTITEIERMIYDFLCDPEFKLNSIYHSLEFDNDQAARQETDYWAQAEIWRVVNEPSTMKFLQLHPRELAKTRGETSFDVLRRVVEQENVSRWIKRFVLRGQAERAVRFGQAVQTKIAGWPKGNDLSVEGRAQHNKWFSWNHTLAVEERKIWIQVGRIRQGTDNNDATDEINKSIKKLEKLYWTTVEDKVFEDEGRAEYGFASSTQFPAHPAHIRVRRLLSHAYNHLGYGRRTLGHMYQANAHYVTSLEQVREDRDQMIAHRAKVLNNQSRALSELGWNGIGVCLDGRDLRLEMAEEVPLASSYNTLALIYDDMGRYEDAPLLAAKAIAYCRRAQEKRQLGLALRQMAESLRHAAERLQTGQRVAGSPDNLFNAAETLLNEARAIFVALNEVERLVEVDLEFGSLFRDRVHMRKSTSQGPVDVRRRRMYYKEALNLLDVARRRALEHNMSQHALDALVNQARVHYYAGDLEASEQVLDWIFSDEICEDHLIRPESEILPPAGDVNLRDRNWVFRHLSTAQRTRASMAADRFQQRVESRKKDKPDESYEDRANWVSSDSEAQRALRAMMEAYALALAYAELFSPRSRSIGALQNDLYRRIHKFNRSEFEALKGHIDNIGRKPSPEDEDKEPAGFLHYPVLREHSLAMLRNFLDESFGAGLRMTAE